MFGFYRFGAAVPKTKIADVAYNTEQILSLYQKALSEKCAAVVFPELSLTSYSCGDLFFQRQLLESAVEKALYLAGKTLNTVLIFGIPLMFKNALYNCAVVAQNGRIRGVVPKIHLPNYREFYEKRQFSSGKDIVNLSVNLGGEDYPFGHSVLFSDGKVLTGLEICEDLWSVTPPSLRLIEGGAQVIFNLSASNEFVTKSSYRRDLIKSYSAHGMCAYVFSSCGNGESVSDVVFSGHAMIGDNGKLAVESLPFESENQLYCADIDVEKISSLRMMESSFDESILNLNTIKLDELTASIDLKYTDIPSLPFIPAAPAEQLSRCEEIVAIQSQALARRMEHVKSKKAVLGISGGLDSTLALLIAVESCKILKRPFSDILAVTMPGFGTTDRTYNNALELCRELGVMTKEIDIKAAALQHFKDIGHDAAQIDVTYENTQARERTQILMDLANKSGGLVIGTGDLSEIALGWCTYNGDQMSMYGVNASIPKTLIRYIIEYFAVKNGGKLAGILRDIADTPVSPELLPADSDGKIQQKTEDILGPYELHDFFLYHFIKYGASPDKMAFLARRAFAGKFASDLIDRTLEIFIRRFFTQQFKRNSMPDGPKVGSIALSPRGDWRMPSEASYQLWRKQD